MATNHRRAAGRHACVGCGTCDGFACAVGAKNDVATVLVQPLLRRGLHLRTNAVVTRLVADRGWITGSRTDRLSGRKSLERAGTVVPRRALMTLHLPSPPGSTDSTPAAVVDGI
jgi:choline dehydrogenase-like flavoprotein